MVNFYFLFLFSFLISCNEKDDYILYNKDNLCDSIVFVHQNFNNYKSTFKNETVDAKLTKNNDSIKIFELAFGPTSKINKILIKKQYAVFPGLEGENEFFVKKIDNRDIKISDSEWKLMNSCNYDFYLFRDFKYFKKEQLFNFNVYGVTYSFKYKTNDSINYQLYIKSVNSNYEEELPPFTYDENFKSFDIQLQSNNIMKVTFYGLQRQGKLTLNEFKDNKNSQILYFYKLSKNNQ